jgi:hypothetical protein
MTIATHQYPHGSQIHGKRITPPVWRIPSLVFFAIGLASLALENVTDQEDWSVLGWICSATLVYAITILYRGFRDGAVRLLTDPFLVLVGAFSVYFLFGTLLLVIGPEDQAQSVLGWYPTNARDAVRVTAMNLIGLATTLFATGLFPSRRIENAVQPAIYFFSKISINKIFWLFLIVGAGAKLYVLSVDFSNTDGEVILGSIRNLAGLVQLAILVGVIYKGRGESLVHLIAMILAILDSATGVLLFNKSAALMPIVVLLFGLYLRRPTLRLAAAAIAVLAGVFLVIVNPIGDARMLFEKASDRGISTRIQIVEEAFGPGAFSTYGSNWWPRFCYTVAQVAAVDLYDRNEGGEDMELLAWAFVPRVLVSGKPIMTRSGTDFNAKVTGSETSSSGIGLFVSGYYNLGWVGIFMASILAGWILATFAAIARAAVTTGSMIIVPVGLLGSFMAFRIDGHFIADYLGPFGMVMVPLLLLLFILRTSAVRSGPERLQ